MNVVVRQGFVDAMKDDGAFSQLEKLFAKEEKKKPAASKEKKKKGPTTANLLDSKRSNNVAIMLAQVSHSLTTSESYPARLCFFRQMLSRSFVLSACRELKKCFLDAAVHFGSQSSVSNIQLDSSC